MLPARLGFIPDNAIVIIDQCAIAGEDGRSAVFNSGGMFFSASAGDRQGVRTAMLASLGLASVTQLAEAFGVSRTTVYRNRVAYEAGGVEALSGSRGLSRIRTCISHVIHLYGGYAGWSSSVSFHHHRVAEGCAPGTGYHAECSDAFVVRA